MTEPRIFDDTALPIHYRWQVIDFMRMQWPGLFSDDRRLHPAIRSPEEANPFHVLIAEGDVLISYATVIPMQLDHEGQTYNVHGLGNVLTYPSFRGEGYGSRVVAAATELIEASDADVGGLFCLSSLADFYGRHGWEAAENSATLVGPSKHPIRTDVWRMMVFVSDRGEEAKDAFRSRPWHVPYTW